MAKYLIAEKAKKEGCPKQGLLFFAIYTCHIMRNIPKFERRLL